MNKNLLFLTIILAVTAAEVSPANKTKHYGHFAEEQANDTDDTDCSNQIAQENHKRLKQTDSQASPKEAIECPVCLLGNEQEAFLSKEEAQKMLNCTHINFHKICLATWKIQNNTCPLCRIEGKIIITPFSLHVAIQKGNSPLIEEILRDQNIDLNLKNSSGEAPLSIAAEMGMTTIVSLLLARGADGTIQDDDGMTALDIAANEEIRQLILDAAARQQ